METTKLVPYVVIVILILVISVGSYFLNKEHTEKQILIDRQNIGKTIDGIENPGAALIEKRKQENQKIDKKISAIDSEIKNVKKLEGGNKIPDTKKVIDEIQKADLNNTVDYFNGLGFTGKVASH